MSFGLWMLLSGLAGSVFTMVLAGGWYIAVGQQRLEHRLQDVQVEFEKRVKTGVLAAGQELLPALREQVKLGFEDALRGSRAAGIAEGTAKIVTGSTDLLVDSLSNLFGLKKK